MNCCVGIDLGSTTTKAVVLGETGEVLGRGITNSRSNYQVACDVALGNCKNNPRAAVWEAAKLRGVSYRAIGQEPSWVLEIDREKGFLLVTDYGQNRQRFPYSEAVSDAQQKTGRYSSELDGERIEITITGASCHDSMSGEAFSSQVEIDWREQTLRGCGRALH